MSHDAVITRCLATVTIVAVCWPLACDKSDEAVIREKMADVERSAAKKMKGRRGDEMVVVVANDHVKINEHRVDFGVTTGDELGEALGGWDSRTRDDQWGNSLVKDDLGLLVATNDDDQIDSIEIRYIAPGIDDLPQRSAAAVVQFGNVTLRPSTQVKEWQALLGNQWKKLVDHPAARIFQRDMNGFFATVRFGSFGLEIVILTKS